MGGEGRGFAPGRNRCLRGRTGRLFRSIPRPPPPASPMLRPTLLILAAAVSALAAPLDAQHGEQHWSYAGPTGPQRWTALGYEQCDDGAQTPIDLSDEQPADPLALRAAYGRWHEPAFTNNGHTVLLLPQGANTLEVAGRAYELLQVHAHVPSEHTLGGHRFAAELHAVHRDAAGGLLVLGTFVETGPAAA